jgi:hypothetical protein
MVMTGIPDEDGHRLLAWTANPPDSRPKARQSAQSHLQRAAATFGTQATAFRSIMPAGGPVGVDGGDPDLDHALTQILELIGDLHAQLSASVVGSMSAFAWRRDSVTAGALAAVIVQTAAIVDGLAVELAAIENVLEEEAYVASRYGVMIGTDGRPPPVPQQPQAESGERHWVVAYKLAHDRAMADAQRARCHAARQLTDLCEQIRPPRTLAMSPADQEILTSSLRGPRELSPAACPSVVKDV